MKIYLEILFFTYISLLLIDFSSSNIWDNIYTQANSPHFVLDDNFQVTLFNEETNTTAGELLISSELDLIKFSLIFSEEGGKDSFIQIIANFTKGAIYFDTEEKCLYKYMDIMKQISTKFIINAYDLLSYFLEDENNYHYIVTNPIEISEDNNNAVLLLASNIINDFGKHFNKYESIYDKNLYADFVIDKNKREFKNINIKTTYGCLNFKTEFKAYNITIEQFSGIHEPENCVQYE